MEAMGEQAPEKLFWKTRPSLTYRFRV